jgi:hypothetical protein
MNTAILENASFTATATICSILPSETGQDHTVINRTHGCYFVQHPKAGEPYALSHVAWKKDYADVGDHDPQYTRKTGIERRKEFTFDARQIASDICNQINNNGPGEASFFGVFVCDGNEPTAEELTNANERLRKYFSLCVAAADSQWSANPRHDLISGVAKRGARWLKLNSEDHGWMSNFQVMADCPACGTRIKPGVALCRSCGAILDPEKAAQFGIVAKNKDVPKVSKTRRRIQKKNEALAEQGF